MFLVTIVKLVYEREVLLSKLINQLLLFTALVEEHTLKFV